MDTHASEQGKGTILVIEDDLDFSEYVVAVLRDHGYATAVAMNGSEALAKVKEVRPSGITLDILLPGRTGISIYRSLRKDTETKDIPVVVLTGVGTEGKKLRVERFFAGRSVPPPDGVLQKPAEPEAIVRAVDEAIRRKAS